MALIALAAVNYQVQGVILPICSDSSDVACFEMGLARANDSAAQLTLLGSISNHLVSAVGGYVGYQIIIISVGFVLLNGLGTAVRIIVYIYVILRAIMSTLDHEGVSRGSI